MPYQVCCLFYIFNECFGYFIIENTHRVYCIYYIFLCRYIKRVFVPTLCIFYKVEKSLWGLVIAYYHAARMQFALVYLC